MKKFEYLEIERAIKPKELNKLGAEGWELVVHTAVMYFFFFGGQFYIFKRELKDK